MFEETTEGKMSAEEKTCTEKDTNPNQSPSIRIGGENPKRDAKWSAVIACSYSSKLDWLAYNISRTFSADKTERRIGTEQVKQTILDLKRHTDRMETLKGWLT